MRKIAWGACVALVVFGLSFESAGFAKPPDLPVDLGVDFEQTDSPRSLTLGYDFLSGNLLFSFSMPWNFVFPWQSAPKERPKAAEKKDDVTAPEAQRRLQARAQFATAERCLKNGNLDKARTYYEETHLLAPESRVGRRAIQRLSDIDNLQLHPVTGPIEEQEPAAPSGPRSGN